MGDIIHFLCRMRLKIDLLLLVIWLYVDFGTESTGGQIRTARMPHFFCLYYVVSIDLGEGQASTRDQCNRLDRYINVDGCMFCCSVV